MGWFIARKFFTWRIDVFYGLDILFEFCKWKIYLISIETIKKWKPYCTIERFFSRIFFFEITQSMKVPERFTHLFSINHEMSWVQPVSWKSLSGTSFCLCDFILVMWKYEILSSHMDIYLGSKILHRTSRTLYMPTGTSFYNEFNPSIPLVRGWVFSPW